MERLWRPVPSRCGKGKTSPHFGLITRKNLALCFFPQIVDVNRFESYTTDTKIAPPLTTRVKPISGAKGNGS